MKEHSGLAVTCVFLDQLIDALVEAALADSRRLDLNAVWVNKV